ncbi:uncharacterized protein PHACADRAFT_210006 [Phanerochaete carnosa HHB-10118-sp]|uniref:Uncharacterized protein n=1 Tax=Phanerochaete carnosa (strain HHB-10118-sp) TaxID=650164 RepID=K5VRQ6_PHACS|nr:uncharacterized protein PHACADRAFT_210006 [Phanerochaete carnosa HHB-10118-sp]EKM54188.1 hypothetical protein PHACADRAFT_210006 [Phanerochaete carnosa HHB-10118-sp]
MSLPDGKLTLQGFSQLGDANPKKHAMVVRLSTETMEALERLESGAKIDIDFGEGSSKLYIGDTSFTMSAQPETVSHELYLRMVQPNKPGAILKLQGNVVGKLHVERQLNAQAETAIRDRTQQAEKQRHERKIELLDAPLAQAPRATLKKPKVASKPTKSTPAGRAPPDPNRSLSSSTSLQPSRVASPRISPRPLNVGGSENHAKYRLIHFVALKPRTHEEIIRLVGGSSKESRKEVQDLVPEVLERVRSSDPAQPAKYRLKTESWLEVRPFENEALRADEVQKLVDQGQEALRRLYIPESDPLWNNFRRDNVLVPPTTRPSRPSPVPPPAEPKKSVVTKKTRPSEMTKKVTDTIPMKDESVRPPKPESMKAREREGTPTTSAAAAKPTARRVPGSGFRAKSHSSTPPTIDGTVTEPQASLKRPSVDHEMKREPPSPVPGSSRPSSLMPPPPGKTVKREEAEVKRKKHGQSSRAEDTREKKRPKTEPGEVELSPRKRHRDVPESDYSDRDSVANLSFKKRKTDQRDSDKLQVKAEPRDMPIAKKDRDASPLPARVKTERQPTPLTRSPVPAPRSPALLPRPPVQERVASAASNGSRDTRREDTAPRNGSAKPRRREPSFTSSEDDDPKPKADRKRGRSPAPLQKTREREQSKKAAVLPSDARALRRLYDERIPEFVALRSKKKQLRDDLKRLQRRMRDEGIEDLSTDCEIPDDVECESLHNAEAAAREECVRIRDALYRLTGQEIPGDNGLWSEDTD